MPYSMVFARRSIVCIAALEIPYVLYSVIHRIPQWPNLTATEMALSVMGFIGMFAGICCAAICLILDAKRRP